MILLIDIGNSRSKWALTNEARGVKWLATGQWDNQEFDQRHWLAQFNALKEKVTQEYGAVIEAVAISCVATDRVWALLGDYSEQVFAVTPYQAHSEPSYQGQHRRTLVNSYKVAQALGIDRWLAMVAGIELLPSAFAVIDAGTAITLDVVNSEGLHLGGHIIPGQQLMQSTLLKDTGRIGWSAQHNLDAQSASDWLADNTRSAVELGALHAGVAYLEYSIAKLRCQFQLETIIITGGDASQLMGLLSQQSQNHLKHEKDLVLQGLFYWLMSNLTKKTADKAD